MKGDSNERKRVYPFVDWQNLRGDTEFQRIMSEVEGYWKHYNELFGHA